MKISCQSCQAKYTIADEKVLGKIVKIRCKKCGATIVINGNEQEATAAFDAGAQAGGGGGVYDYTGQPGGEPWTVNVSDGDQRSMTTPELVAAYRSGTVNDETYCWKDGMADWLPLREVPEIHAALTAGPQPTMNPDIGGYDQPPPPQDDQPTQAGFSSLFGGGGMAQQPQNGGASLFGGDAAAAVAAPIAAPSAARRVGGRGGGGADLFGAVAQAGGEQDVMTSAPTNPQPVDDKLTGARNENSVLFSLAALTTNAPKEEKAPQTTEGSGLIDIRALSASMETKGSSGRKVDDIMNLSGGGAFSAALAAPVLAPSPVDMGAGYDTGERKKSSLPLVLGIVGGFVVVGLLAAVLIVMLTKSNASSAVATKETAPKDSAATPAPTDSAGALAMNNPAGGTDPGTGAKPPSVGAATGGAKPATGGGGGGGAAPNPGGGGGGGGGGAAVVPPTPAGGGGGGGKCAPGDLQCAMAAGANRPTTDPGAGGGGGGGGGSAPFDRGAAQSALGGIASSVGSCKRPDGPTGSGHIKVTFQPNGSVSTAEVDAPPFAGSAVGGCVASKFRGAHIPAFSGSAVTVGKSFSVN